MLIKISCVIIYTYSLEEKPLNGIGCFIRQIPTSLGHRFAKSFVRNSKTLIQRKKRCNRTKSQQCSGNHSNAVIVIVTDSTSALRISGASFAMDAVPRTCLSQNVRLVIHRKTDRRMRQRRTCCRIQNIRYRLRYAD